MKYEPQTPGDGITRSDQMNIKVLKQKKAELMTKANTMVETANAAGFTAEEQQPYDALLAEIDQVDKSIAACEKAQEMQRAMGSAQVAVIKDNNEDDPKGGFKDHREFLKAVMRRGTHGIEDPRLAKYRATQGSDEQQVGSDPYGGYIIPVGVAPGVLTVTPESDPIAGLVRNIPMTAPIVAFNARVDKNHSTSVSGGLTVTRKPETVDATSSRMKFEQIRMVVNDQFGLAFATENILTDSPESFVAMLASGFSDEFAANLMNERLNGTGVGEYLGIMESKCLVTVAKENAQSADTILKENIDKMTARCWRYGRAVWHANHDTRPQLASLYQLVGTTGGQVVPYFQPGAGPNGEDMLNGRPIFFTEFCASLGNLGDIVLAQWSEFLEGTYQQMRQDESIHVRFLAAERAFRFYKRNDGKPWWTAPLTPKNGATLSPFVTLAAR